jgi:hypothetical protein
MLAAAAGAKFAGEVLAADVAGGALSWAQEPQAESGRERRYRATAQILVLSIPLVRWPNVGGGSAVWRETELPQKRCVRLLEFTGFSRPERAAGLNRLGFIREISRIAENGATESLYFGLMTASPEETAEEARKSLHSTAKQAAYTAIDGRIGDGMVKTVVAHFEAPSQWSFNNREDLIQLAHKALASAPARPTEGEAGGPAVRPFLETLADALRPNGPAEARFAYAGRFYRLRIEKEPDAKATANFRQRRLVAAPPAGGVDDDGSGEPAGGIFGLSAPAHQGRVHQAEPGECRSEQAPGCGASEAAVEDFGDEGRDDQHQEKEAVSEPLDR